MGNVIAINDSVSTTLVSLTRAAGEGVGSYAISAATFNALTGTSAANYTTPTVLTGTPLLTVTRKDLTATIADQTKVYGTSDPALAGISVPLSGQVNRTVLSWNGCTPINDSAAVGTTLSTLVRQIGQNAGSYNITGASFAPLTGASAGNYNAPPVTGTPRPTINAMAVPPRRGEPRQTDA